MKDEKKQPQTNTQPEAPKAPVAAKPAAEDSAIADKLAELEKAIQRTNELNKVMEDREKELAEKMKNLKPVSELPAAEKQHVIESHASKAERTKASLKAQETTKIFVPLEGKEKKGTLLPVTINGYRVNVPKGVYVEVPEQVGQIVMDSLNQTQAAERDNPYNLDNMDEKKRAEIFS